MQEQTGRLSVRSASQQTPRVPAMAIEIERKFLVRGTQWRAAVHASQQMAQGYLGGDRSSVRVRIEGERAMLNIKSKNAGHARLEFEYSIDIDEARQMLDALAGDRVTKTRHLVQHQGHLWEVDEFAGANAGLIVAEIELDAIDEVFDVPDWALREVSDERRYYNSELARLPFSEWADRAALLKELAC